METPYERAENANSVSDSNGFSQEDALDEMYKLGKHGIIFPRGVTTGDMAVLIHSVYIQTQNRETAVSRDEFDQALQDCFCEKVYEMHDGIYYDALKKSLSMSKKVQVSFIQQCFTAFEQGLYFVCACGLLSLIEGVLAQYTQSANTRLSSLFKKIDEKINQNHNIEQIFISANIRGYIDLLTEKSDFQSGTEPNELNRHWLLHGRSQRNVKKADCLRLFVTLSLILEIV